MKAHCAVDGHYFNIIRGAAKDATLKQIPTHRLAALYKDIQTVYDYYADQVLRRRTGRGAEDRPGLLPRHAGAA